MTTEPQPDAFERNITPEELKQMERERAERLDPANRRNRPWVTACEP